MEVRDCGAAGMVLAVGGQAAAESVTVPGDQPGDITSMFVDNARSKLTVKIDGLSGPCDARQVWASATWRGTPGEYRASGVCSGNTTWVTDLLYFPVSGGSEYEEVDCPTFSLTYRAGSYRVVVPRSCLSEAPGKVRVVGEGLNYGSATPGYAKSKLLARG